MEQIAGQNGIAEQGGPGGGKRRVNIFTLWFKTLGFVLKRGRYYVLAVLLFFLYFMLIGLMNMFAPRVMAAAGWLVKLIDTFALAFLFSLICGWNKRRYLLAQVGIIYGAYRNGTVPKHAFRAGLALADARFPVKYWSNIFFDSVRFVFGTLFKKERKKGAVKESILVLLQEVITVLVLMFAGLFGHLGSCLIAWFYHKPGADVNMRGLLKGLRRYFHHFGTIFLRQAGHILVWALVLAVAALPMNMGFASLIRGTQTEELLGALITVADPTIAPENVSFVVATVLTVLADVFIVLIIVMPFGKIRAVRCFTKLLERDGDAPDEEVDALFARLNGKMKEKLSAVRAKRKDGTQEQLPEGTADGDAAEDAEDIDRNAGQNPAENGTE